MTKGQGLRQYRACVRCRSRKTRCDLQTLGEPGKPPCAKCIREGANCVLAGSRRGGDFTQFRRSRKQQQTKQNHDTSPFQVSVDHASPRQNKTGESVHDSLQNPSDALLILAHAAGKPEENSVSGSNMQASETTSGVPALEGPQLRFSQTSRAASFKLSVQAEHRRCTAHSEETTLNSYSLIEDGTLSIALLTKLLRQYAGSYHQFLPLAPATTLEPDHIIKTIRDESFLLTAILVIASKDRPDLSHTHKAIWNHMRKLILDVVLGMASVRRVGCVEGLLILGEWTTINQGQTAEGGEGAAWSILGLAVRLAYLLRLEDNSFKLSDEEPDDTTQRERLAWTFTYLSDRQISIRMGQAFWCRGPSLSARFTAHDFPTLQPRNRSEDDLASLLQAQVELTTLFGNAHDILFASRSRTAELMTRGDYTKYVDDTGRAMAAWQQVWETLSVSSHLRSCLSLMYEYLRLYVNAFAFQAVLYRASLKKTSGPSFFPDSIMASPDARHIYTAVDAAERMLTIVTEDIDPEKHLRYMPARFYLYEIHSAVFLYKAHAVGAIDSDKHFKMTALMRKFISVLSIAAIDDSHIASRYARLLEQLWLHRSTAGVDTEVQGGDVGSTDPLTFIGPDFSVNQMPPYEDIGLQPFDCSDTFDTLFSMPPVFPLEQPGFFSSGI